MATFAQDHQKWQRAQQDAARVGTRAAHAEAEKLRQDLIQHPAVQKARTWKTPNGRSAR